WIFRPCHSTLQIDAERDIWRRCSSSSQSLTVEPDSTVPSRFVAPAWNRSASTSDVLPVPRCPTTATLRIFPGSSGGISAPSSNAVELLGREHEARGRTRPQQGWSALLRARVGPGAACSRARSRQVLLGGALKSPRPFAEHRLQGAHVGLRHRLILAEAPLPFR